MTRFRVTGSQHVTRSSVVLVVALVSLIPATSHGGSSSIGPLGCVRSKSGPSPGGFGVGASGNGTNSGTWTTAANPSWGFYDISYDCQLRTLLSSLNDSLNIRSDDVRRVGSIRVQCKDALLFESFLSQNQTLFKLANLKSLEISSCKIRRIPAGLWTQVKLLQNLSIHTRNALWSSSYALELERASFESLDFLQTLDLSYNNLWSVPEGVFCPLKSLKELKLSWNKLTELEELVSGGGRQSVNCSVSKLVSVDLSWNSLRQVVRVTKAWSPVQKLLLNNNLVEQLEDSAFSELTNLQSLNLSSNRLVALPPTVFKLNVNLRQVSLANNSISALAPGVFSKLAVLVVLDLGRNTLNSQWIRSDVFQGLKALRVLRLSHNQLSVLDAGVLKDLENLQILSLDNNRLETVSAAAFSNLKNLISLDLASNKLVAVEARMLGALKSLRQLYLDHNKIKNVDENALANCTSLQDLGLSGNLLQEVPTALRTGLSVLRSLDLGENRILSVTNESFQGLAQLYGLRMVENRLAELPPGFCSPLKNLRVLNLAQNRLTKIHPRALTSCPQLRALRLDSNLLDHLPTSLASEVPSLLWLNVSENRVTRADYRLLPGSIEWLDLSHNSLESFGELSSGSGSGSGNAWRVSNIRVLDLSYNKLNELKMTMIPRNVETLRVNHNKLKLVFPDSFARLSRISRVELMWNELERVELSSLKLSTRRPSGGGAATASAPPAEFYLTGNPFQCDCSSEWLFQLHQQYSSGPSMGRGGPGLLTTLPLLGLQYPKVMDLDALACTRSNGSIQLFSESHSDDFYCTYKTHCDPNCHCCDFSACDCAMVCPDGCECLHDSTWSRNIVKCGNSVSGNGNRSGQVVKDVNRLPMTATEIYLDGNNIPVLTSHSFIGKRFLKRLWLNNSQVQHISNKTFNGLGALEVLRLEDNFLQSVDGFEFAELSSLRELYLHNNLLKFVDQSAFAGLKLLNILRLDGNLLVSLSLPPTMARLKQVFLAGNPYNCDCEFVIPIRYWMTDRQVGGAVTDVREMHCYSTGNGGGGDAVPKNMFDICPVMNERQKFRQENLLFPPHIISNLLPGSASAGPAEEASPQGNLFPENSQNGLLWTLIVTLCALVMLILALLLIFRKEIYYRLNDGLSSLRKPNSAACCWPASDQVWNDLQQQRGKFEYSNTVIGLVGNNGMGATPRNFLPNDSEKLFDAYFLYSSHDEDILLEKIVQVLDQSVAGMQHDNDNNFYRLCLHYRDLCLSPGNPWNPEMILGACDSSKRIVLVLSRQLIAHEWNNKDFRNAITQAVCRHHKRFIVILLPEDAGNANWNVFQAGLQKPNALLPTSELPLLHSKPLGTTAQVTLSMLASMKSSTISFTDVNFWPKMRILLPPPCLFSTAHRRPGGFNTNNRRQQRYYQPSRKFAASMNNINGTHDNVVKDEPPPLPPPRNPQHQMALSRSVKQYNAAYSDQEGEYHIYSSLSECPTLPCRSGGRCGAIGAGARHQGPAGGPWPPGYCGTPIEQLAMAQLSRVASPGNNRPVMRELNTGGIIGVAAAATAVATTTTASNKSFNVDGNGANNRGNLLGSDNQEINDSAKIDNPLEATTSSSSDSANSNEAHASLNSVQQQQQQPMYFV